MKQLILNNIALELVDFGRNSYSTDEGVRDSAMVTLVNKTETLARAHTLMGQPITSLVVKVDDEVVYDAGEINAKIATFSEILAGNEMAVNLNLEFH